MELENIKQYICQFVQADERQLADFSRCLVREQYRKGDYLLHVGNLCEHIWFLDKGIVRHFIVDGEWEGTVWFSFSNDLTTDAYSFTQGKPAVHNIIAVTDVEVVRLHRKHLEQLYAKDAIWERFGRLVAEQHVYRLGNRANNLLFLSGKAKYEQFIKEHPEALQHIPLHQIADFIGVSFETLSRIRAKRD